MGMESFFVTIASKKMKKDISEPAYFTGYDEHMNR